MSRRILIVNDDGIEADGIKRLAKAALKYGEVWVVAPESQRSAASHSITLRTYIEVWEHDFPIEGVKAYAISGTPADCVRVGILNILPAKPDVVLSGINYGYNAGTDVQYSATVGAAMEAVFQGVPAIAFSEPFNDNHSVTDKYLDQIINEFINTKFSKNEIVNVNFPDCSPEECKGILYNRKCSESFVYKDRYKCEELDNGKKRYMVDGIYNEDYEEGSDLKALLDDYVSVGIVTNIH